MKTILIACLMMIPTQGMANSCQMQLAKCDKAVRLGKRLIEEQQIIIKEQGNLLTEMQSEYNNLYERHLKLEEESKKWYTNPINIGIIGVSTGLLIGILTMR